MHRQFCGAAFGTLSILMLAGSASAAPVTLDKSEAVGEARQEPGNGLCGTVTKFANQPSPLTMIDQAIQIMNRPSGDPAVVGRTSRVFQNMNFSVGVGSEADFKAPGHNDDAFPYCQDPNAMPSGSDDNNIAMRIRGYLNVKDTMGGAAQTFVVKCDDACVVHMGKTRQVVLQADDDSPTLTGRRARWVVFKDPGLYPVEIVYFQNTTSGYLEWSQAAASVFSGDDVAVDNLQWQQSMGQFKPTLGTSLFSSIAGSDARCIECGASGGSACTAGEFCGDGLCQACNIADHCGASCTACPSDRRVCSAGQCVQCTTDAMCGAGSCDLTSGTCSTQPRCASDADCGSNQLCAQPSRICQDRGSDTGCTAASGTHDFGSRWPLLGTALLLGALFIRRRTARPTSR